MNTRARRLVAAAASTVLLGLGVAACSATDDDSGGESSADSGAATSVEAPLDAPAEASAPEASSDDSAADSAGGGVGDGTAQAAEVTSTSGTKGTVLETAPADPRSLIKEGNVALRSTDVGKTVFGVRKIVQAAGGEVSDDDTQADEDGAAETALLTIRVPVDRFDAALAELKGLGAGSKTVQLINSSSSTQDVSTEVVDNDVRVALQKRSIERISLLLDRARSLRDVISIERELASREADLGSLEKQQKFLADQTSLSTITVSVERPSQEEAITEEEDESGFAAGLADGWNAFKSVTTGLLTGTGALLPFALLALVVGVPLRVWLRRRQPRPAIVVPDPTPTAG